MNGEQRADLFDYQFKSHSSIDKVLSAVGLGPFQFVVLLLAGLTYAAYSCESLTFTFISAQVTDQWCIDDITFSILPAATCASNVIGGVIFSYLADKNGRIWPYAVCMILVYVFVTLSAFSPNFPILITFRVIASIGVGGILAVVHPMLIEFLPVNFRGKLTLLTGFVRALGSCVAGGMAFWLIPNYSNGWRYFIIATAVPSLLVAIFRLLLWIESPRYLTNYRKEEKAWNTLVLIARINRKDLHAIVDKNEFLHNLNSDYKHHQYRQSKNLLQKFIQIFKAPYSKTTICYLIIYNTQNLAYYGSTLFLPQLLQNLGTDPYFTTFTAFTAQIPGILLMAIIVEWPEFGRLNTLRLFTLNTMIFLLLLGFVHGQVCTPIFLVLVYFSMIPINTLLLTIISETYPTDIRAMTIAFITSSSSVNGIWLPFVSGYLANMSNVYVWLPSTIWASFFLVQLFISLFLNMETRGQELQDSI